MSVTAIVSATGLHPGNLFFIARSGIYSSAPVSSGPPEGFLAVVLYGLFGAFCGLMAAFVLFPIVRYIAFLCGKNAGGSSWAIWGAALGTVSFALWAAFGRE